MKIYSLEDRVTVKIDDLIFKISPLTKNQKTEIIAMLKKGEEIESTVLAVKYAVKGVEGLEKSNGEKYELKFENNVLADDCLEELLNIEISLKLQTACSMFLNGVPSAFINPSTGEKFEGIDIVSPLEKSGAVKKNKRR